MPVDITETRLVEAALELIIERGYDGATTKRIAARAGVNEVTLFRRFGSKAKLLLEAFRLEIERFTTEGVRYTGDAEADLAHLVSAYHEVLKKRGRFIPVLLAELPRRPELREGLELPRNIVAAVTAILGRYQAEGALVAEPPFQAAVSLLGPIFLAELAAGLNPLLPVTDLDLRDHVRRYLEGRMVGRTS